MIISQIWSGSTRLEKWIGEVVAKNHNGHASSGPLDSMGMNAVLKAKGTTLIFET